MPKASRHDDAQQLSLFDQPPTAAPPARLRQAGTPPPPSAAPAPQPPVPHFQHPRAQRSIALAGHQVGYEFRRARRRSIGFVVGTDGLSVSAPRWVAVAEVEQALQAKAGWILRKLHEQQERARRLQAAKVVWQDGTSLPFLGDTVIVLLDPRVTGAQLNNDAQALPGVPRRTLHLGLPQTATQDQIRELVQAWLQRQARRVFEERCAHFAPQLGVRVRRLSLSSAATRWGSASADGSVRLNWRLVHFALPVIDYVVTHELAHLREMNHSPAFWDVVRSVLPDFERSRGALRSEVLPSLD
jgi:predicted metal-dependent hydrolase